MTRMTLAVVAILTLGAPKLAAQDTARVAAVGNKSPTAARVIGIFPGAGHIYAGETGRGFAYMGGILALFVVGVTAMAAECYGELLGAGERCDSSNTDDVAAAAILALWGWSIYDAGRAAHRTNAKRQRMRLSLLVAPVTSLRAAQGSVHGVKLGVSLR
jgi:hypothetical protein